MSDPQHLNDRFEVMKWLATRFMFSQTFGEKYLAFYHFPLGMKLVSDLIIILFLILMGIPVAVGVFAANIMPVVV